MQTSTSPRFSTGTFSYAAELLMGPYWGAKCSPKVDSYSFGVVLHELISKEVCRMQCIAAWHRHACKRRGMRRRPIRRLHNVHIARSTTCFTSLAEE